MGYRFQSLLLLLLLSACASAYKLSDEGMKYRASLTEAEAYKAVQTYFARSGDQAGLCSAHTNTQFQPADLTAVNAPYVVFTSYYEVLTGVSSSAGALPGTINVSRSVDRRKGPFKVNLRELNRIRVHREVNAFGCRPASAPLRGYIVMIDNKGVGNVSEAKPAAVMINVAEKNLDRLMAALTFLSPNAQLVEGAGL